jgi:hypothetical protein
VTTEGDALPPAGWYRDPNGASAWRYWDGSTWTDHVSSWGPEAVDVPPGARVGEERRWARYAKWAFVAFVPFQVGGTVLSAVQYDRIYHGTLLTDQAPKDANLLSPSSIGGPYVLCAVAVLGLTLLLGYWCMQAARAAKSLGIPIARGPGWAMAGWVIPILNLWWPPQTIRSFAKDRTQLGHVVGWWICWIVAVIAGTIGVIVAGSSDLSASIPFLVVSATSVLSFALLGVQVVDMVLAVHEQALPEPS